MIKNLRRSKIDQENGQNLSKHSELQKIKRRNLKFLKIKNSNLLSDFTEVIFKIYLRSNLF